MLDCKPVKTPIESKLFFESDKKIDILYQR